MSKVKIDYGLQYCFCTFRDSHTGRIAKNINSMLLFFHQSQIRRTIQMGRVPLWKIQGSFTIKLGTGLGLLAASEYLLNVPRQ